jgi:murein DD-endopeptidase MepM/ murein hydrolase activator NlpD
LRSNGIAVLENARSGIAALGHLASWPKPGGAAVAAIDIDRQRRWSSRLAADDWSTHDGFALLAAYGIAVAATAVAHDLNEVLAAADHVVGRLFEGPVGGIVIYAYDEDGHFVYYYAHLERYRRGLAIGDRVAKGSVIGYVGTTGNAPANTPHLHFQVMKRGRGRAWWDGPPINPHSFFALDGVRP